MIALGGAVALAAGLAGATAQDLPNAREAAKMLHKTGKSATEVHILRPDLVPESYKIALQQAAGVQKYFEALAVSPTEGLLASSGTQAINFHTAATAHAAAIYGCNKKKKAASESCVVVAEFLPKGYNGPSGFSLSSNATEEFTGKYKRAWKSKAFAISPSTGNWGSAIKAANPDEARILSLADCNAKPSGNGDCVVVSQD